jgi:hypothetical protein
LRNSRQWRGKSKRTEEIGGRYPPYAGCFSEIQGTGYTGVMADVLNYAVNNPEFLKQAVR